MNQDTQKFIENIVAEAALDSRISDGVVNLGNTEHVVVIAEKMHDIGVDEHIISEFIDTFIEEGKYPERQAYNKEGWLVTFPSKEYRDAAIKKGSHSISDPTHGKGGMNLYYKKKGKQKRQVQQDTSATLSDKEPALAQPETPSTKDTKPTVPTPPTSAEKPSQEKPAGDEGEEAPSTETPEQEFDRLSGSDEEAQASDVGSELPAADVGAEEKLAPAAPAAEPTPPAPTPPPPPPYAKLSKEFATAKGWKATPYGEWRNAEGETQAVVSLSDEVVPLKSVDRDELKLFVEKRVGTM